MEKINEFFKLIYDNGSNTFYIVLGGLSLLFIIIITVILLKGRKEKPSINKIEENNSQNKEINITNDQNENSLSETKVLNDLLMQKDEVSPAKEEILANKEEKQQFEASKEIETTSLEQDNVYIEKTDETDYNIPIIEIKKEIENKEIENAKNETNNNELLENSVDENVPKFELSETNISKLDNIESEIVEAKLDTIENNILNDTQQIDIPKMKPIDIESDLLVRDIEKQEKVFSKTEEPENNVKEDSNQESITILTNDEIRKRLESIQKSHTKLNQEENKQIAPIALDKELENIIKTVGLEDTMIIPNIESEESILGK